MKPRPLLAAALGLILLLCACGQEQSQTPAPAEHAISEPASGAVRPEAGESAPLSAEESRAMAMVRNANRALLAEGFLYCYDFDADWSPALARYRWQDGKLDEFTVLARGCVPEYLCRAGGWLWYIDRTSGALERVPESGGERQIVRDGPCRWLSQREGLLYYCDGEGRFLSLDPASLTETTLLDGPCAFAYPLEEAILWQDAAGGIFRSSTRGGGTRQLCPEADAPPLLLEDRLWYLSGGLLYSLRPADGELLVYALPETDGDIELLPETGGLLLRGIRDDMGPQQWSGGPEGPFTRQARGYQICDWLGDGLRVDTVYEPDGRIRCFLLTQSGGVQISFLAGRTT